MIRVSDLPEWAKSIVVDYFRNKGEVSSQTIDRLERSTGTVWTYVEIHTDGVVSIGGVGHEGGMQTVWIRDAQGNTESFRSALSYESLINYSPAEQAVYTGGKGTLPIGAEILKIERGWGSGKETYSIRLYTRDDSYGKRLPANDLTELQLAVLSLYCGYKTFYRKDMIAQYRMGKMVDQVTQELVGKGLLTINKAGAVGKTQEAGLIYSNNRNRIRRWPDLIAEWRKENA
jgi:hypothetical protein